MWEISASIFPFQAADGANPWGHIKACGFLLGIVVFCAPLGWAQAPPLTNVSIETSDAMPVAPSQVKMRPLTSDGKASLYCGAILSQTQSELRPLCASGHPFLRVTNKSALELAGRQDDSSANAPKQWLTNESDGADDQSLSSRDLKYYGGRTPLIGKAIVRIAEQADSHPKITRMLLMIDPQF